MQLKSWPADEQFHSCLWIGAVCSNAPIKMDHSGQHIGSLSLKLECKKPTVIFLHVARRISHFTEALAAQRATSPRSEDSSMNQTIAREHRGLSRSTSDLTKDYPNKI